MAIEKEELVPIVAALRDQLQAFEAINHQISEIRGGDRLREKGLADALERMLAQQHNTIRALSAVVVRLDEQTSVLRQLARMQGRAELDQSLGALPPINIVVVEEKTTDPRQ